ncbi:hypothetical protein PVAND_006847 [Polypedilum vanderplanki]|uniref:Lipase domain-containing protein n=1 Tax=Polypedilum vanderplanki TaxID=319348 RepID=A0A9J6C4Z5_POLVA|nr:hypothetical protein PVAND_006847 [Polypedilum vanderplanki]
MNISHRFEDASNDVFFILFTRENPTNGERINFDSESIRNSHWNPLNDVRILIHGFWASYLSRENIVTTAEFLRKKDYNIIAVDWSVLAAGEADVVIANIPRVGVVVGQFIDFLYSHGFTQYYKINIIGHSFGSHVAGFAGKNTNYGKINAIFATDPSHRVGTFEDPSSRLDLTDANYVEAIITSTIGFRRPISHATFYPNFGLTQPGCNHDSGCDHHRATEFYTESINSNGFVSRKCNNFEEIDNQNCQGTGVFEILGGDNAKIINGNYSVFYLETNAESPFARG